MGTLNTWIALHTTRSFNICINVEIGLPVNEDVDLLALLIKKAILNTLCFRIRSKSLPLTTHEKINAMLVIS
jgi:hypothetical protein